MDMERVIQEAYDVGYHRGYEAGKLDGLVESNKADRPRGEWIKRNGTINCSVCKRSNWSACFEDTVRSFNFCPNCGARMKGADDE